MKSLDRDWERELYDKQKHLNDLQKIADDYCQERGIPNVKVKHGRIDVLKSNRSISGYNPFRHEITVETYARTDELDGELSRHNLNVKTHGLSSILEIPYADFISLAAFAVFGYLGHVSGNAGFDALALASYIPWFGNHIIEAVSCWRNHKTVDSIDKLVWGCLPIVTTYGIILRK